MGTIILNWDDVYAPAVYSDQESNWQGVITASLNMVKSVFGVIWLEKGHMRKDPHVCLASQTNADLIL